MQWESEKDGGKWTEKRNKSFPPHFLEHPGEYDCCCQFLPSELRASHMAAADGMPLWL